MIESKMNSKFKPSSNSQDNIPVTVFVESVRGGEIASKLSGYFVIHQREFRFKAIAFGRIGGHNISLNISKKVLKQTRDMGIDTDALYLLMQRKLVEGDIVVPEKVDASKK
jgi:hypothetical protein